jgi:hypothetical protein
LHNMLQHWVSSGVFKYITQSLRHFIDTL